MITRLIYVSRPFGFDVPMLNGILADARRRNRGDGITGALVCRSDIYLQLIEGPRDAIESTYGRIANDNRHTDVTKLLRAEVDRRLFPAWDMLDDPAQSWLWPHQRIAADDALRASAAELTSIFERIALETATAGKELVEESRA